MNSDKKKSMDMVHGSLVPKIILYALPLAFTGILQQLFNAADIAVVGQFSGKEAVAAVGSNSPIIGLLVNLFLGISLGANVVIAHASGQGNDRRIETAVHTSIVVAVVGGILMSAVSEAVASPIISVMRLPEEVSHLALKYLRIYLLGLPVIFLYNFESAIFRSRGNSAVPLFALLVSGIINIILNLVFVVGFKMTVDGVAWATVISNFISSMILFVLLCKSRDKIRVDIRKLRIDYAILGKILKIGIPSGIQGMVFSLSNIIVQSAINSLGSTIIAASTAGFNLEIVSYYMMNSFNQSCTTFVGQNHGAGENARCRLVLRDCLVLSFVFTAAICTLTLIFNRPLLSIFTRDSEVIAFGLVRLKYIFFAYIFSFAQEVLSGYLRGFGISTIPALSAIIGVCGTRLLWIFLVFPFSPSFSTIMQVYPISLGLTAAVIMIFTLAVRPSRRYAEKSDI